MSYVKFDPNTATWRTSQGCFPSMMDDISDEYSKTWPRAGTMRDGECYRQPKWEHRINEIGSGLLPTPTVSDTEGGCIKNAEFLNGSWSRVNKKGVRFGIKLKDAIFKVYGITRPHPNIYEAIMMNPIGWTELRPLETDKYRQWLRLHGIY
jgi:hypothetical protein